MRGRGGKTNVLHPQAQTEAGEAHAESRSDTLQSLFAPQCKHQPCLPYLSCPLKLDVVPPTTHRNILFVSCDRHEQELYVLSNCLVQFVSLKVASGL